jgi:hypothetical protein
MAKQAWPDGPARARHGKARHENGPGPACLVPVLARPVPVLVLGLEVAHDGPARARPAPTGGTASARRRPLDRLPPPILTVHFAPKRWLYIAEAPLNPKP